MKLAQVILTCQSKAEYTLRHTENRHTHTYAHRHDKFHYNCQEFCRGTTIMKLAQEILTWSK